MRKMAWGFAGAALLLSGALCADEVESITIVEPITMVAAEPVAEESGNFETLMICIWKDLPESQMSVLTSGVKIGVFGSFGAPVYGVEGAVICGGSDIVNGFKGSLAYTVGEELSGLGLAPVNYIDKFDGVQIGAVNIAKEGMVQFGLVNYMENGFLPIFPIVNFAL